MARLLPLLLILAACGPAARGPLTLPPPPVLRPGHGLPTYDPMHPQAKPERSPHKRLLPSTQEPGLWAGDGPKASAGPTLEIDGILIPLPSDGEDSVRAGLCADVVGQALSENKGGLMNMRRAERDMKTCLVFMAWRHCMGSPTWADGEASAAAKWVAHADALMLGKKAPIQCRHWQDAFDKNVRDPFEWYLKSWYFRTHRPRAP